MVDIIYIIVLIWGLVNYANKKIDNWLFSLAFMYTQAFLFLPSPVFVKFYDYAFLSNVIVFFIQIKTRSFSVSLKKDKVAVAILILVFYATLRGFFSVLFGEESFSFALKTVRKEWFLLIYFVLANLQKESLGTFVKKVTPIVVIGAIFYFLQFIGVVGVLQKFDPSVLHEGHLIPRIRNIPYFTTLVFFFLIGLRVKNTNQKFLILLTVLLFLFHQSRGNILAIICAALYSLAYKGGITQGLKKLMVIFVCCLPLFPILSSVYGTKKAERLSFFEEIETGVNIIRGQFSPSNIEANNTFIFRMLVLRERIEYLSLTPKTILFGVGAIHEESPYNRFNFVLGSASSSSEDSFKQQIDTTDVAFLTSVFRYGLVYLFFIVVLLCKIWKRFASNITNSDTAFVGMCILLKFLLRAPVAAFMMVTPNVFLLLLLSAKGNSKSIQG